MRGAAVLAVSAALLLAACANRPPIAFSSQYVPPDPPRRQGPARRPPSPPAVVCRVHLGEVADKRPDTESLGEIDGRPIRAADAATWIRSGLGSLGRDGRIVLVADGGEAQLELGADLLKAYMMSITTAKTTDVVLGIHYAPRGGAASEGIYRGQDSSTDWTGGEGETHSALNRALAQALEQVEKDLLARCAMAG